MRHLVVGDGVVHGLGAHPAKADVRAGDDGERPGEAPAVAVEHGQCPQIDGMGAHAGRHRVRVAHEGGASVVVDHALGIARRARRVVEADRLPLILGHPPGEVRIAGCDQVLVAEIRQRLPALGEFQVVGVDNERPHPCEGERLPGDIGELAVDDENLRSGVVDLEGDDRRVEARVERMEHRPGHGHAVVGLEHGRAVGQHDGDGIARYDAVAGKGAGKAAAAGVEGGVGELDFAVNDRRVPWVDGGRPLEQRQRRQGLKVRRALVEVLVIGIS